MYRVFYTFVSVVFLVTLLTQPQPAFTQINPLTQDEIEIIQIQFKLYETYVQGDLPQYMELWAPEAEFRAGGVHKGKQEIEAFVSGLMEGKPRAIQNRVVLTIRGKTAVVSTRTLHADTPTAPLTEMDIVYRYVKEGDRWLIQVEDVDLPHAVELPDAAFEQTFREVFYPAFQKAVEMLDPDGITDFTAADVEVISRDGREGEGVLRLTRELEENPLIFQDDVYVNREKEVIGFFRTKIGYALLDFEKHPEGQLTLRKVDFSFRGLESVTDIHPIGKHLTTWGRTKVISRSH